DARPRVEHRNRAGTADTGTPQHRSGRVRRALATPYRRRRQTDGRIRHWVWVPARGHWLRVVTEAGGSRPSMCGVWIAPANQSPADTIVSIKLLPVILLALLLSMCAIPEFAVWLGQSVWKALPAHCQTLAAKA